MTLHHTVRDNVRATMDQVAAHQYLRRHPLDETHDAWGPVVYLLLVAAALSLCGIAFWGW